MNKWGIGAVMLTLAVVIAVMFSAVSSSESRKPNVADSGLNDKKGQELVEENSANASSNSSTSPTGRELEEKRGEGIEQTDSLRPDGSRRETTFPGILPTESIFVVKKPEEGDSISKENQEELFLDASLSLAVLGDEGEYDKTIEGFISDEAASVEAKELAEAYREIFDAYANGQNGNERAFTLQELSCGNSLCMGSVTGSIESQESWTAFKEYFGQTAGAYKVYLEYPVFEDNVPGEEPELIGYRFVLSTDPSFLGVSFDEGG
jgi:hypothetical protein